MKENNRFGRYYRAIFGGILCILVFLTACGKMKIEPGVPLQELRTEYEAEGAVKAVTTLKDGTIFAITAREGKPYCLYRFNAQGERTGLYPLDGYSNIDSIAAEEDGDTVYFMGQSNSLYMSLAKYRISTGELENLCDFGNTFAQVTQIVLLDDKIYAMGQRRFHPTLLMSANASNEYDFSAGDTLMYYSLAGNFYLPMELESPISIASGGSGTLIALAYFRDDGYCLVEYDPKEDVFQAKTKLEEYKFYDFAVCNEGKSLLYNNPGNSQGIVMSDFDSINLEIEVYDTSASHVSNRVWYGNGLVFLQDFDSNKLVSFPLADVQKNNKTVSLISTYELSSVAPYGCGYALERIDESWDKIALKMLAQDQDYDLCMGSSDYAGSITLRDSGTLYPLNDLPGIEEYLDKCFPYIREAATDENGMIWMLPFSVNTWAIRVEEEQMEQAGVRLRDHMTISEFADAVSELPPEAAGRLEISPDHIGSYFFQQYFRHNTTAQNEFFLECLSNLRMLYQNRELLQFTKYVPGENRLLGLLDCYGRQPELEAMMIGSSASLYNIPKGRAEDKNSVTVYFLAVNQKSPRLAEALRYLADLTAYLTSITTFSGP